MKKLILSFTTAATLALACANPGVAGNLTDADIVTLQVAMQSHIDSVQVDGAVLNFDPATTSVVPLYPTKAHPKIMSWGDYVIMCADFADASGKSVMGNFYMAREGDHYVVFQSTFGADPALMKLMDEGKVAMAN